MRGISSSFCCFVKKKNKRWDFRPIFSKNPLYQNEKKLSLYYIGFLLDFSLKSHLFTLHFKKIVAVLYGVFAQFLSKISPCVLFFDKKHKSTDWCSIECGVPSDGEKRVHCHYFAIFTYAQLAARFPIGNCHLFAWNRNRNRHFYSGIPDSQNHGIPES